MEVNTLRFVGQPVPRTDAFEKVTGQAKYGYDIHLSGMLVGKALRSAYPHARIKNIDTSRASRLPGVRAVVVGKDVPFLYGHPLGLIDQPFMAIDKVRYRGEAVAAVAATDEDIAEEALALIKVDYEELPAVYDPIEAVKAGAPILHENLHLYKHAWEFQPVPGTNICHHARLRSGDIKKGFTESDHIFENTFKTQTVCHVAMEPHAAVAMVDASGSITVIVPHDSPHGCRSELAEAMNLPLNKVRVIVPFMGGGFGGKGGLTVEPIAVALAMKTRGLPVKVALTRAEVFATTMVRHASIIRIKTGVKKDGTLAACEVEGYWNKGAYSEKGPRISARGTFTGAGPYRIPNLHLDGYCVYTNGVVAGAHRGFGAPQAAWAYESQMDLIARELNIDPLEFRLKNVIHTGDMSPTGEVMKAVGLEECLKRAAEAIGWYDQNKPRNHGKGIACMLKYQGTGQSACLLNVNPDGTMNLAVGTMEIGQGADTILSQIVAEELSVPISSIKVDVRDTDYTPFDRGTIGSRSTYMMGNAVKNAAQDVRNQLINIAARILKVDKSEIATGDSKFWARNTPDKPVLFKELALRALNLPDYGPIVGRGQCTYPAEKFDVETAQGWHINAWMYAAQAAEVEVDTETGSVKILNFAAAHDVGKAINPVLCSGQIEGGTATGIGMALYEQAIVKEGFFVNSNLHDYKIATAADMPPMQTIMVEEPHSEGPYGAKGVGEPALAPTSPAIANAICDATGLRIKELPMDPEKVKRMLKAAQASPAS